MRQLRDATDIASGKQELTSLEVGSDLVVRN